MGYVIAVSGSSGSGKSTLVNELSRQLNAVALYFDAYQATTLYPTDMMLRLAKGDPIDLNEVQSPHFDRDIMKLKKGEKVTDPWERELPPSEYIVVEEPFGRLRREIGNVLDFVVFVDTPLNICLARRVLRDLRVEYATVDSSEKVKIVEDFLASYINGLGNGYQLISDRVGTTADLTVNGLADVWTTAKTVLTAIRK